MDITDHARLRLKERCGLLKKAMRENVDKALVYGLHHSECTGRLKKYVDYLFLSHMRGTNIRLYVNYCYIFDDEKLITVLPLPKIYQNAASKIIKRREVDDN